MSYFQNDRNIAFQQFQEVLTGSVQIEPRGDSWDKAYLFRQGRLNCFHGFR